MRVLGEQERGQQWTMNLCRYGPPPSRSKHCRLKWIRRRRSCRNPSTKPPHRNRPQGDNRGDAADLGGTGPAHAPRLHRGPPLNTTRTSRCGCRRGHCNEEQDPAANPARGTARLAPGLTNSVSGHDSFYGRPPQMENPMNWASMFELSLPIFELILRGTLIFLGLTVLPADGSTGLGLPGADGPAGHRHPGTGLLPTPSSAALLDRVEDSLWTRT